MALALILSSHVAASRVGGGVQAIALALLKVDSIVVPTVLYGRHPGWGPPGGGAVSIKTFQGMLDGIEANGLFARVDVLITGYFARADQVRASAVAIDKLRAGRRQDASRPRIIVDPIMGDTGKGLYVAAEVADAIAADLMPRADLVTPNAWELERLTGQPVHDPQTARQSARLLGRPVLVSSVIHGPEIGVVYADDREAWFAAHTKMKRAPNGVGDLLTALFAAALLEGQPIPSALARAVGGVCETITAARAGGLDEMPVVAMGQKLFQTSPAVRIERLD